jgi:hypothetical protein
MRTHRKYVASAVAAGLVALLAACGKSDSSTPTSPAPTNASLAGTVIAGVGPGGLRPQAAPVALANVTVKIVQNGATTATDASGNFSFSDVPSGPVDLTFSRADVNAKGNVSVPAGQAVEVTVSIVGSNAVITPRGHAGAEIEGLVASVNAAGGTLVVTDERLGSVTVNVTSTTVIRHGSTAVALSAIAAGNRVHVKAVQETNGTYTATDVNVQSQGSGSDRNEVSGSVLSVDANAKSFVVQTSSGSVTVTTTPTTTFRKNGAAAAFTDVGAGQRVDVEGTMQGSTFVATSVEIEG